MPKLDSTETQLSAPRTSKTHHPSLATLLGPAFVAAIAYVDPGNVAANITAGARYSYLLVWVLLASKSVSSCLCVGLGFIGICRSGWGRPRPFG